MASFNQTFDFANWDQAKFDTYRNIEDERADKVARFIINSPHYTQVYEALSKIAQNNCPVTLQLFSDIIKDRALRAGATVSADITTGMAGAAAPPTNSAAPGAHDHGDQTESEVHNADDCLTDKDHEELVEQLNDYFNDLSLFDFVETDKDSLEKGSDIFNFYYVHCTFALGVRSLMKQYSAFNATQVLKFTKLIYDMPYRRIMETVQFVMDVMDPKGFEADGYAIRSIQKLRLVHAMIRVRIHEQLYDKTKKPGDPLLGPWKADEWGQPINQQDMIFAVHTFSIEVLEALIGIGEFSLKKPEDCEKIEAYYMMWHHIGRALGTMDEINPVTFAEGKKLQQIIYAKQFVPSPNVDILVPPLVGFVAKLLSVRENSKVYALTRYYNPMLEDKIAFKKILKIDLDNNSDRRFYRLISFTFFSLKMIFSVILAFMSEEEKKKKAHALLSLNYELLAKVIFVASDGQYKTGSHFRVADGFGLPAPVINYADFEDQKPFFYSLMKLLFLKIWNAIKEFFIKIFKKKP